MTAERPTKLAPAGTDDAGLATLAQPGSLLERMAHGAAWVVGWRMARRLVGLVSTLILVRLLVPADFGLVALGYGFVGALDALSAAGVEQAIIRDDKPDRALYDTGFTVNLLRALGMAAVLAAGAGTIAGFLGDPRLYGIVLAFAAMTALTGVTNIGILDFQRYIAFDKEFVLKIVPRLLSVTITILAAVIWRSYWALVAGIVSTNLSGVVFSYWMHPYRPRLTLRGWRRLVRFSLWMWVLGLINTLRGQAPNLIVGRLAGAASVGILSVGSEVASLPSTELIEPLSRASFAGFAAARRSDQNGAKAFLRMIAAMALIVFPAGVGISLVADPVVRLAFGPAWMQAVPLIEVLGVAGTMTLFGSISGTVFAAHAWMRPMAKINAVTTTACLLLLAVLVPRFGILGAVVAIAITDALNQGIYLVVTLRRLGLRLTELLARVWRSLAGTVVMAFVLVRLGLGWTAFSGAGFTLAGHLLGAVALGAGIYFAVLAGAWLMSGRPDGAESDLLALAQRIADSLTLRRRRA
ncbi:MAG: lipopolysaccharide biosynthesis protein [Rhodospirillales bacterium]|nr:lipopolysaccharide biosynthesis protein [Rhodospirillales bacterium]